MADLTSSEWIAQLLKNDNSILIDVRTSDEVAEGFIPNAININVKEPAQFLEQINKLDKTAHFYVYCKSGARSTEACAVMNLMCDIPNAFSLLGGFENWKGEVVKR